MCHEIACATCGKPTWEGCGEHIEYALKHVPLDERCTCPRLPVTIEPKAQNTTKR
ncbi:MAG: hypothetical protein JHD30_05070 [Chloroflexi bacterium]|jgi:hypothetical protein|nr:hypothetical protein [Chloroflexota bacterium]